jgi:hypothetical protein
VVHGGDWNLTYPYDSLPAFQKADSKDADAVKGDFRVSSDNIGMVMHSSPVEIWESLDCFNQSVEEHSAEENSECHMEVTNITFSTVPEVLAWADGVINFMFCVKETEDIPRAITTLVENNATNRCSAQCLHFNFVARQHLTFFYSLVLLTGLSLRYLLTRCLEWWRVMHLTGRMCTTSLTSILRRTWTGKFQRNVSDHLHSSNMHCIMGHCYIVLIMCCVFLTYIFSRILNSPANVRARTFLFEFNDWSSWDPDELSAGIKKAKS